MVCVVRQSLVSGVFQGVLESLSYHLNGSEEFLISPVDPPADNVQKVSQVEQDKCTGQSGHIRAPLAEPQGGTTQGAYWRPLSPPPHSQSKLLSLRLVVVVGGLAARRTLWMRKYLPIIGV